VNIVATITTRAEDIFFGNSTSQRLMSNGINMAFCPIDIPN
jgi:hypothetical protein